MKVKVKSPRKFAILLLILFCNCLLITAQENAKIRAGIEAAIPVPIVTNIGVLRGALDLKYNFQDNMNIGLRVERADYSICKSAGLGVNLASVTYDYYFLSKKKLLSPFIGSGAGYYFASPTEPVVELPKYNNPYCFFRIGTEIKFCRVSLNYNFIRSNYMKGDFSFKNCDYLSFNLGVFIGGGKWKN